MTKILSNFRYILTNKKFYIPIIFALLLIAIGYFSKITVQSKMKRELFSIGGIRIDWWSISHLILYVYFGYFFPEYFIEFLIIGSLWELFESTFCKESFVGLIGCRNSENYLCKSINKFRGCDYWYGKIDDVVINMIGFVIGALLAKKYRKI